MPAETDSEKLRRLDVTAVRHGRKIAEIVDRLTALESLLDDPGDAGKGDLKTPGERQM